VLADTSVYVPVALPVLFVTVTLTGYDPDAGAVPEMMPPVAIASPAGKPVAENASGACPLAGIVNRNGVDAFAPMVNGPWSRGVAGAGVMEMLTVVCARAALPPPNIAIPSDVAPRIAIRNDLVIAAVSIIECS
jgi:hypothetical protein